MEVRLTGQPLATWQHHIQTLLIARLSQQQDRDLLNLFCHPDLVGVVGAARECMADQVTSSVKALASEGAAAFKSLFSRWNGGPEIARLLSTLVNQGWENAERQGIGLRAAQTAYELFSENQRQEQLAGIHAANQQSHAQLQHQQIQGPCHLRSRTFHSSKVK